MQTKILAADDIRQIVRTVGLDRLMDETIARLTLAFRHYDPTIVHVKVRDGFAYSSPALGLLEWMPIFEPGRASIKIVGYHPSNPELRGLPTILSTVATFDSTTGHLTALVDGTFLTALRTGAASAVASRTLASPRSRVLGMVGAGAQAVSQLHALSRVLALETVLVYDRAPERSLSFLERVSGFVPAGLSIKVAPLDEVVSRADVLCTQTSVEPGEGPVFADRGLTSHVHVNAIGSDFPGKTELPLSLLRRSFVCPDFPEQAMREGECQQLTPQEVGPSLAAIVKDPEGYRFTQEGPSVFDSTGFALEDAVTADLLVDHAEQLGVGTSIELESVAEDPWDPYAFAAVPAVRK